MSVLELHILLIMLNPVKSLSWSPNSTHLSFTTNTGRMFLWSLEGASVCDIPNKGFSANNIMWSSDGKSLLL